MMAQGLIKHTARLHYIDAHGEPQSERHAAWSAQRATTMAYRRAKSMIQAGTAKAYRITHHEQAVH
jgi:hypothetical protein